MPVTRRWIGRWLCVVGLMHTALGVLVFHDVLGEMLREGVWDSMGADRLRQLAVWFLVGGAALLLLGGLLDQLERDGRAPRPAVVWGLLGLTLAGIVVAPRSGFWALLPAAIGLWLRARPPREG